MGVEGYILLFAIVSIGTRGSQREKKKNR